MNAALIVIKMILQGLGDSFKIKLIKIRFPRKSGVPTPFAGSIRLWALVLLSGVLRLAIGM